MAEAPHRRRRGASHHRGQLLPPVVRWCTIGLISVFIAIPVLYMVSLSLNTQLAVITGQLIPSRVEWSNYVQIWSATPLAKGFLNSAITAGIAALAAVVIASIAAYPLARYRFFGRAPLLYGSLGLQLIPGNMILLPLFVLFALVQTVLGVLIIGTYWGVMIIYLAFALPLAIWLMVGYMSTIPRALEEAVFVDGGGHFQALLRVVAPLAVPGMVVTFLFSLLVGWNDVLFATVLTSSDTQTLAVDLNSFLQSSEGSAVPQYSQLMAASVVTSIPIVAVYLALQRYLVSGLGAGALK